MKINFDVEYRKFNSSTGKFDPDTVSREVELTDEQEQYFKCQLGSADVWLYIELVGYIFLQVIFGALVFAFSGLELKSLLFFSIGWAVCSIPTVIFTIMTRSQERYYRKLWNDCCSTIKEEIKKELESAEIEKAKLYYKNYPNEFIVQFILNTDGDTMFLSCH